MVDDSELLQDLALSSHEYEIIVERLGRRPNPLELGLFGSLWSEHCGYKHSRPLLRLFTSESPLVLVGAGEENAGVVEVGDGLAVALKVESHNHPSAVEPFQGAATGVGGIVRDILSMGARPIALLNSLRFGPLSEPRNQYLFREVVSGISWYGNCIGVPDVGGEVAFSPSYSTNPLVNAMCVGVLPSSSLVRAHALGKGNLLLLVGADTGRDGIHGASGLASRPLADSDAEGEQELRSTVQVGNPFLEKVLIEACLEALSKCGDGIVGMQDLGAAGLTSTSVECAGRAGAGVEIDIEQVPRRAENMTPYEVMLSESQERMLLIVRPEALEDVNSVFSKWDLNSVVVGKVTDDGVARIYEHGSQIGAVPVKLLTDAPQYRIEGIKPPGLEALQNASLESLPLPDSKPGGVLLHLLTMPNIVSRASIFRQYDHQVQTNTVVPPGQADAAVLRLQGTNRGIALCIDGNGRACYIEPYIGGAIAVAEACRNLTCVGAKPVAITDCLNFGDPSRPDVYYQLEECIKGMAAACRILEVPVVSGNVSLYNEQDGQAIYPTPVVGAIGVLKDIERHVKMAFAKEGDVVVLLGATEVSGKAESLGASEYLEALHGQVKGCPSIDLEAEARVQRVCRQAITLGLLHSAHDISEGGLAVTLAECCISGGIGFRSGGDWTNPTKGRWDATLFGENQSRIVVSLETESLPSLQQLADQEKTPLVSLGVVSGNRLVIQELLDLPLWELEKAWGSGFQGTAQG